MNLNWQEKLNNFFDTCKEVNYGAGEMILKPNESLPGVFWLKSGKVDTFLQTGDGLKTFLNIQSPFLLSLMLSKVNKINNFFWQAKDNVKMYFAPKEAVLNFIDSEAEIAENVNKEMLKYFVEIEANNNNSNVTIY